MEMTVIFKECMLGSLDYMNWDWKNYPVAWESDQYVGHAHPKAPTIVILEAVVASCDLRYVVDMPIWNVLINYLLIGNAGIIAQWY